MQGRRGSSIGSQDSSGSQQQDKEYHPKFSKLQEQYQKNALKRQKEGIVKPQIVTGKQFKGTAFISKPQTITFKDFEVGQPMTQTILMTNVSFSFNSFKLLPLKDQIKDFFQIQYVPSGRLSAGLSTTIKITFIPRVNSDIIGVFPILAETGLINIPLLCYSKKALIAIEQDNIDFGNVVRGQESKKVIKFQNSGALKTKFYIKRNNGEAILDTTESQQDLLGMNRSVATQGFLQTGMTGGGGIGGQPTFGGLLDQISDPSFPRQLQDFLKQFTFRMNGQVNGYSPASVTITFRPILIGSYDEQFTIFLENQDHTDPIRVRVRGVCVDVPIYVEQLVYDVKILVYDHTYREKIVLHNRSPLPMKIQLSFPREFKPYLEFNPTLGYIQGNSEFQIWLKFKPTRTILSNCERFLKKLRGDHVAFQEDSSEMTMSVPIKVVGASQTIPVRFRIVGVFTVSAVTVQPSQINFGEIFSGCNASQVRVNLKNHSLLPQQYAFFRLPRQIEAVPPQATLMPKQNMEIKLRYRPSGNIIGVDENSMTCMTITGNICTKQIKIPYTANILKSPLVFDKQKLQFPALPLSETSQIILSAVNNSGRSYQLEIVPPLYSISGVAITPIVQTLPPNGFTLISFKYLSAFRDLSPFDRQIFGHTAIVDEFEKTIGVSSLRNKRLQEMLKEKVAGFEGKDQAGGKGAQGKAAAGAGKGKKGEDKKAQEKGAAKGKKGAKDAAAEQAQLQAKLQQQQRRKLEQEQKKAAVLARFDKNRQLAKMGGKVYDFQGQKENQKSQHYEWLVPCYFRQVGRIETTKVQYFEVRTVSINKVLVADKQICDFGQIAVSLRKNIQVVIRNIGSTQQTVKLQPLNPYGGFSVLNAVRAIPPGGKHSVVLQFEPFSQQLYEDKLLIYSKRTLVSVKLLGRGVRPEIGIDPQDGLISFNHVLEGDSNERRFKLCNRSSFPVNFNFDQLAIGEQNLSGLKVFTYIPAKGTIPPNEEFEVKSIFSPDHPSETYFEKILINIPNQVFPKHLYLSGCCWDRQLYSQIYFPLKFPSAGQLQSMMRKLAAPKVEGDTSALKKKIVLQFVKIRANGLSQMQESMTKQRQLSIGSCSLNDNKLEKNGTYEITLGKQNDRYFECDALKGVANAGQEVVVNFKFKPPPPDPILEGIEELNGIGQWVECKCELKMVGGFVNPGQADPLVIDLILRAYIEQI